MRKHVILCQIHGDKRNLNHRDVLVVHLRRIHYQNKLRV